MADITRTKERVSIIFPLLAEVYQAKTAVAVEAGQWGFFDATDGTIKLADASGAGTALPHVLILETKGAGEAVSVLKRGHVAGFDLDALNYWVQPKLSDTAGEMADAAGTVDTNIPARVVPMTDGAMTKVLYVDSVWA